MRDRLVSQGIIARKSLGQNFIFDLNVTRRIAAAAGDVSGITVIEIGPGPGGLTRALLERGAFVKAIERDAQFIPLLQELAAEYPEKLEIIQEDALNIRPQQLTALQPVPDLKIIANLPYNISTKLLTFWLEDITSIQNLTLMFQKEVAMRLVASPRSKEYGRLSILCQWLCSVKRLFDLSPQVFTPPPKVISSVVQLTPRPVLAEELLLLPLLKEITAAAFGQRRKMIKSSLSPFFTREDLESCGLSPQCRAEELLLTDFLRLASVRSQQIRSGS